MDDRWIHPPKHVTVREKRTGSGVWWVFINYERKRVSRTIGQKWKAQEVAREIRRRLFLPTKRKSRHTSLQRLNHNISCRVNNALKGRKSERGWENLVGYSLKQLKEHLEKQFKPGMMWSNYGLWHVDHVLPIVAFNSGELGDSYIKTVWALSNLQPLWARENLSKGGRIFALKCTSPAPGGNFEQVKEAESKAKYLI